jgi:tetratricopeptide (TPR) repeat protein
MKYLQIIFLFMVPAMLTGQGLAGKHSVTVNPDSVAILKSRVVADPEDMEAHKRLIKYTGIDNADLIDQYDKWMTEYPNSVTIPFAIGEALYNAEYPQATKYLLKVVELNPQLAKAYFELSIDAQRWGDFEKAREYLKKACEAEPESPDYAFYYASSFSDVDPVRYRKLSLEVVDRFPGTERAAQAIYWLALRTADQKEKTELYERSLKELPPDKFNWSSGSMTYLFDVYLETNTEKAVEFAGQMKALSSDERDNKSWEDRRVLAESVLKAKSLVGDGRLKEAVEAADLIVLPRYSSSKEFLLLFKAEVSATAGEIPAAYDILTKYFAGEPTDRTYKALLKYGMELGKDESVIKKEIHDLRYNLAEPATPFSLYSFMNGDTLTLADLKGNVILLTYWFPGCGPCRGEFPNFESVIRKFKNRNVKYVGINISPEQDEYVVPFVRSSGYSFTPLKDEPDKRGNLTARGAPTNYLLDKDGNIVFRNFRTDDANERTLELMIEGLLE